ncbi:hypothetical protein DL93DRAFT_128141 [Clavulina sp. PMI_390]|nr:hypothetical protein DL93DRAFT_128141 [Clavulina sp. PMI_390]
MSFPSSPSSQGAQSPSAGSAPASSPALNSIDTISSGQSAPQTSAGAPSAGGAVRRKPTRRANTAERRATHNAVERQRRETLNGRFLDLAALLPNLATVRRPSKSAIVNSSIALVRSQRRLRAIHARQIQQLVRDAESLRREVNEWRAAHPHEPVPSARASLSSPSAPLEPVVELHYAPEIASLLDMEDTSAAEDRMNEQERIAYEMRGGDSGPLGASIGDDGEDDLNEEDGPSSYTGVPTMAAPATAPEAIPRQHNLQQHNNSSSSLPSSSRCSAWRALASSLPAPWACLWAAWECLALPSLSSLRRLTRLPPQPLPLPPPPLVLPLPLASSSTPCRPPTRRP